MDNQVNIEQMKDMFKNLIDPVVLDIDKEMEELKIPEDKDFLDF